MDEKWRVSLSIRSKSISTNGRTNGGEISFRLSRCLLAAADCDCLEEVLKLVSIMSVDTIFLSSLNSNEKTKMQRQKFTMNEGDHLTLLNVYKSFIANKKSKVRVHWAWISSQCDLGLVSNEQDQPTKSSARLCHSQTTPSNLYRIGIDDEIMRNEVQSRPVSSLEANLLLVDRR